MIVIGLTGSIAMGKSEVARILQEEGLALFDADLEVHRLYDSAAGVALIGPLAPEVVTANSVDRSKLTQHIMQKPDDLAKIENAVHTEIARRRMDFVQQCRRNGHAIAVVDIPLLFERGIEKEVDVTIVVSAPAGLQRSRALARPGMTVEKFETFHHRQLPDMEKRQRADFVIENDGSLQDLREKTRSVLAAIRKQVNRHA